MLTAPTKTTTPTPTSGESISKTISDHQEERPANSSKPRENSGLSLVSKGLALLMLAALQSSVSVISQTTTALLVLSPPTTRTATTASPSTAILSAKASLASLFNQTASINNQHYHPPHQHGGAGIKRKSDSPPSSSSFFADIEDLQDSSIKTRAAGAKLPASQPPRGGHQLDFDLLIQRIDSQQQQRHTQPAAAASGLFSPSLTAAGDANNRTTMRFFRNNKTFASIVYTNPAPAVAAGGADGSAQRQARLLVNCHLVDLEKHSSDVALFESKYELKTTDIEFMDMMLLIDSCTNIARLRPLLRPLAGPLAPTLTTTGSKGPSAPGSVQSAGPGAMRPLMVVGRPLPMALPSPGQSAGAPVSAGKDSQQQNLATTGTNSTGASFRLRSVMKNNEQALKSLGPSAGDSSKLNLTLPLPWPVTSPPAGAAPQQQQQSVPVSPGMASSGTKNLNAPAAGEQAARALARLPSRLQRFKRLPQARPGSLASSSTDELSGRGNAGGPRPDSSLKGQRQQQAPVTMSVPLLPPPPPILQSKQRQQHGRQKGNVADGALNTRTPVAGLLTQALKRVGETGTRLVLGEVTPPPSAVDGHQGGIKEALQEITSYDTSDLMAIWRGILPGTNWCGMGDRATSYNDLGFEADIDICCRAHDFCPIRLSAFSSGYGLFNWSFYTRSHCWCDQNFLDCLQRAESPLSTVVMKFYFSIMKTTCLHGNETNVAGPNQPQSPSQQHTSQLAQQIKGALRQSQFPAVQFDPKQRQQSMVAAVQSAQQRLLLEQIRASLPIPALQQSQALYSKVETNNNSSSNNRKPVVPQARTLSNAANNNQAERRPQALRAA